MTVQFNLFGGTVLKLGTARHHDLLSAGITSLADVGCFALTELGFGASGWLWLVVAWLAYWGRLWPADLLARLAGCV